MIDARQLIRRDLQDMEPYQPILPFDVLSQQLGRDPVDLIKLDANENPYGTPEAVRQALGELQFTHIYPDPESRQLRQALSRTYNVPTQNLLAGAGADDLIDLILRLVIEPGDAVLNCPPTFDMYTFDARLNQAAVIEVPRDQAFRLDLRGLQQAVERHQPKLLFLANPNNPDGSLLTAGELEFLFDLPLLLVLDEAYIEFASAGASCLHQVVERTNLIVLRTFSKWAGLAGLRLGFGAFPLPLMDDLWKIKQPYNVSVAASQAGLASLALGAKQQQVGQLVRRERRRLFKLLEGIHYLEPYPSEANFILCRVIGRPARQLRDDLAQQGILIRYFDKPGLSDHIRISVGRPEATDLLIEFLKGWHPNA
jgi:histidinol-phosphate aminotransferase